MGDLISRKALVKAILKVRDAYMIENSRHCAAMRGGIRKALREVEIAPAVETVEIVRCRDCVYRTNDLKCPMCWEEWYDDPDDGPQLVHRDNTDDDGYCHCGTKMSLEEPTDETAESEE